MQKGSGRPGLWFAVAVVVVVIAGSTGWVASDIVEADNDFCNACHLPSGAVLHEGIRTGFDARPVHTVAGLHGSATVGEGDEARAFRCIDCHGGVGFVGRAKVKALAAKDALVWLGGDFDEPDHMQYPLGDPDCRKCHEGFVSDDNVDADFVRFHALSVHNADLGVNCVECHTVHDGGDDASAYFLDAIAVRDQCGRCHSEFRRE